MIEEKETGEVLDTPIELNEENVQKVKEAVADEVRAEAGIPDEQSDLFKQMCEEAEMPVEFLDKDFVLGKNELDIRKLSNKNKFQMFFRTLVLHSVELKNIRSILLDIMRLILVFLDKYGVEDIVKATDDIVAKLSEQHGTALKDIVGGNDKKN